MNQRIFRLIRENLNKAFSLPKYQSIRESLTCNTEIDKLPWTPARYEKFKKTISAELNFEDVDLTGSIEQIVNNLDQRYLGRFFGEIWKPATDNYIYSGWSLVEEINSQDPQSVLDFGCGYNQFKERIKNLIGIDPYNNCADYMVDILDFKVEPESFDHILALGSLNFNSKDDIETRFKRLAELLKPQGKIYFRANPGHLWKNGPYVDIFPWDFEVAYEFANKYNLKLETFKKDSNDRLYFVYVKA